MSMRTLPLVFINLGGEMLYILDQRLHAHSTSEDKSEKVMNDIVGTMFSQAFMDEILKPQLLYSHRTMKVVLTRLAHVSIMKLNAVSMEKLYELMLMAFKYQVFLCPRPKDLLLISYNHIDTIRGFVKDTPAVLNKVDETHRKIIEVDLIQSIQKIFETHLLPAGIVENLRQRGQNKFILIKTHPD
ncbi:protein OSCP1-like isoform X2 [Hippocampus comes]|uniref:protein OSCP1-like isoform X2 n=1 Tax=Hippocampus comes TaxID=109280 RepID=UPI00094E9F54|nr:PREDICTED: protein OSCP1-like isoform X2 [Hippocampus comes]